MDIVFIYPRWTIDATQPWQYAHPLAALAAFALLWVWRERLGRGPLAAALLFSGTVFPALGFFNLYPMLFSFVADHFQYLTSLSLIALFTAAAHRGLRRLGPSALRAGAVAVAAILLLFGAKTWSLGHQYANEETLYRAILASNPDAEMAHHNLGIELGNRGALDEAIHHFREALRLNPKSHGSLYDIGLLLVRLDRLPEAVSALEAAARLAPGMSAYWNDLGVALARLERFDEAIQCYKQALSLHPGDAQAAQNLSKTLEHARELQTTRPPAGAQ